MPTREALTNAIREARKTSTPIEFPNDLVRSVREDRVRAAPTDADVETVRATLGDDAAAGRLVPFTISTERRASDGHVILSSAWSLDRYRKNPVVLLGHDRWGTRIGDSVVSVVDNRLRAVASFFPREVSPLSWELGEISATRGHAASVGFRILRAHPAPEDVLKDTPWALDIDACRLDEWSLVTLGADEDAMTEARHEGLSTSAIAEALSRMLDEGRFDGALRSAAERAWKAAAPTAPTVVTTSTPAVDLSAIDAAVARQRQLLQG
jgi:hypothetical protein